ncbi:NUMOD1 domain-containing DNA-binding protein [Clostridioides difficile]|uniref:NUMOD1 domain-containing DNA-binding protein n=1 Tax=Clostridioides difficile TaxID=1496 RepID=UPI0031B5E632
MAKIWLDAGTFLEKTIDIEDMFELNLRKVRKRNEKIKNEIEKKIKDEDSEIKITNRGGPGKSIKVFNINTGEVKILKSAKEASKYIKVSCSHASYLARENKSTEDGWKAEYIQGATDGISKCGTSN